MSIPINDNFNVNAPKNIDDRYSVGGVTPYVSVAAANAAIPISRRAVGLTVLIGGTEYWYQLGITDPDLVIKGGGGGPAFISIARVALQALIAGNSLQVGADYAITDFQDKDVSDPNSVVIVKATSTNTISQEGFWKRLTQNKAYGAFALDTGTSGSVDDVVIAGSIGLMSGFSIPYTTSRINTANLVAADININSPLTGYKAYVIAGETVADRPAIIIEGLTAGVDTSSLSVSVTTLTVANLVNLTMGVAQVEQTLDIAYDITADRIINCYDSQYGVTMKYTAAQIAALTYNPIVNWRWGHGTFRNWTINGTGYRNFFDFPSTSGANTIEQNNNLNGGLFQNIVTRRTTAFTLSISNNTNSLNFSNVQLLTNAQIHGNTTVILLSNITSSSTNNSITGNEGSYINSTRTDATNARISISNTSTTGSLSVTNNNVQGQITFVGVCLGLSITLNFVDGTISNTASTYSQNVTISSNNVIGSITIPTGTKNFIINISNNVIQNATVITTNMDITVPGFTFLLTNCTFIRSATAYSFNFSGTGNITFNEVLFQKGTGFSGLVTTFSAVRSTWVGSNMTMGGIGSEWAVSITDSVLKDCGGITNSGGYPRTFTLLRSVLNNITFGATPNLSITNSSIADSELRCSANSIGLLSISESVVSSGSHIQLSDVNRVANVTFTNCQLANTTALCYGRPSTSTFTFTRSTFTNATIDTYDIADALALFSIVDSSLENTTIQNLGVTESPNNTDIARCKFFNSTFNTQQNAQFFFYDCEISNNTITAPPAGNSFTFQSCIFQYQNTDFSTSPAVNYDINDLTLIKDRGLMKKIFTFDGGVGSGQVGVPCIVIPDMIGADVTSGLASLSFTAIITKATIAAFSGLTSVGGSIDMAASGGPTYIAATPVATLNANYLVKNEPAGVINEATKYNIIATPTIASITAGYAEFAIEFLIAP